MRFSDSSYAHETMRTTDKRWLGRSRRTCARARLPKLLCCAVVSNTVFPISSASKWSRKRSIRTFINLHARFDYRCLTRRILFSFATCSRNPPSNRFSVIRSPALIRFDARLRPTRFPFDFLFPFVRRFNNVFKRRTKCSVRNLCNNNFQLYALKLVNVI